MATFVSINTGMKVWGEKIVKGTNGVEKNVGERLADFSPLGTFVTDDEVIIEKLRKHGAYGRNRKGGFIEASLPKPPKSNAIQGIRSAGEQPIFDKDEKLIRLGTLRAKLLKNDGSFRKDASEEDKKELKELQGELGV